MNRLLLNQKNGLLKALIGLVLLSSYGSLSHGQNEGRWYTVEVLIFKRLEGEINSRENWPQDIKLAYPDKFQYLQSSGDNHFRLLPQSQHRLGGFSYTLGKQEEYRVLYHQAWKQQMLSAKRSPSIVISGGDKIGNHRELEGHLKIHIARYLHLTSDLWLTRYKLADSTASADSTQANWAYVPPKPTSRVESGATNTAANTANLHYSFNENNREVAVLRERRRMRSKELHYIDHPLMGLLILITPL